MLRGLLCGAALAAAFAVAAHPAAAAPPDTLIWGVDPSGQVVRFTTDHPGFVRAVRLAGIPAGQQVVGLDVRPADGVLYLLTSASLVYTVDLSTMTATPVSTTPFAVGVQGTTAGMDVNPSTDRIRFVTPDGQNLRVNPANGLTAVSGGQPDIDGTPTYQEGDAAFGLAPRLAALAHTDDHAGVPTVDVKVLAIDAAQNTLTYLPLPNRGVLATIGPLGLDVSEVDGLDVTPDGDAFATLQPQDAATSGLYTIDVDTGAATLLGPVGWPRPIGDIAALGPAPALAPLALRLAGVGGKLGRPVPVRLSCAQPCTAAAELRLGGRTVASSPPARLDAAGTLTLGWSAAGRSQVAKRRTALLTLVVRATGEDGSARSLSRRIRLSR